jgi:hypothetical protein
MESRQDACSLTLITSRRTMTTRPEETTRYLATDTKTPKLNRTGPPSAPDDHLSLEKTMLRLREELSFDSSPMKRISP